MFIDDTPLRALAAAQRGLVTLAQARALGFTPGQTHRLADGRRWCRATHRVLRLVGAPETTEQRALIAVLDAGLGGALDGASAAAWWGIPGNRMEPFEVTRLRDRSTTPSRGDQRREPTLLPQHHIVELDGIPTVVPARALFTIAGSKRGGAKLPWFVERMERMVDNAWSARLVSGATMQRMLREMAQRGRPGINVMRQVLATRGPDYVPPASNLEARTNKILTDAGLPAMRRQVNLGDSLEWIGRVDFVDEEEPLIVEVQSERFHSSLIDRQLDANRIKRLDEAGYEVVEVTDVEVWNLPRLVVEKVRAGRARAARRRRRSG